MTTEPDPIAAVSAAMGRRLDRLPRTSASRREFLQTYYDLPQALLMVIPDEEFADPLLLARRRRDHERIDDVLARQVRAAAGASDEELHDAQLRRPSPVVRAVVPVAAVVAVGVLEPRAGHHDVHPTRRTPGDPEPADAQCEGQPGRRGPDVRGALPRPQLRR